MTLLIKRVLIFFSVALNIGFLVMAGYHAQKRAVPKDERRWQELMTIVRQLDIPPSQATRVKDNMAGFKAQMELLDQKIKDERSAILAILSDSGPIDRHRLHLRFQTETGLAQKKRDLFEAHVLELRKLMGDDTAGLFFHRLTQRIKSKHNHSPG